MAQVYTNKLRTPDPFAFHDIEGKQSLRRWSESNEPAGIQPTKQSSTTPEYPFFNKTVNPPYKKFQLAYAPYTKSSVFLFGTEILGATAQYTVYDPHLFKEIDKKSKVLTPPSEIGIPTLQLADLPGSTNGAIVWSTIASYNIGLTNKITDTYKSAFLTLSQDANKIHEAHFSFQETPAIPEADTNITYNNQTSSSEILTFIDFENKRNLTYSFILNYINFTTLNDKFNANYIINTTISNTTTPQKIYDTAETPGTLYILAHNNQKGAILETSFIKANQNYTQGTNVLATNLNEDLNVTILLNDAGEVMCSVPTSDTWYISGVFIDVFGNASVTPKVTFSTTLPSNSVTLIDTITAFETATTTEYGDPAYNLAGAINTTYSLFLSSYDVQDIRIGTVNWYKGTPSIQTTFAITENIFDSSQYVLSTVRAGDLVHVYGINSSSNDAAISGIKTEIFLNEIQYTDLNQITEYKNISSSSWIGEITAKSIGLEEVNYYEIDKIFYQDEDYSNKNIGAIWEILIASPGAEYICKKKIYCTWSDPIYNALEFQEETILEVGSGFNGSYDLVIQYNTRKEQHPVTIGILTNTPLEVYGVRQTYSLPTFHLSNSSTSIFSPLTTTAPVLESYQINDINDYLANYGKKYDALVFKDDNILERSFFTYHQLTTHSNITGFQQTHLSTHIASIPVVSSSRVDDFINQQTSFYTDIKNIHPSSTIIGYIDKNSEQLIDQQFVNLDFTGEYKSSTIRTKKAKNQNRVIIKDIEDTFHALDRANYTDGYDARWTVLIVNANHTASKLFVLDSIFSENTPITYKTTIYESNITNSAILSSYNIFLTGSDGFITLALTGLPEDTIFTTDSQELTGVRAYVDKVGVTNRPYDYPTTPLYPVYTPGTVDFEFCMPGSFNLHVSALSATAQNEVTAIHIQHLDNYFNIFDIPPLVNFEITDEIPDLNNYIPKQGESEDEISYYVNTTSLSTSKLTSNKVYINTWSIAPGSFPIEEIQIDFGDGTPSKTINRYRDLTTDIHPIAFKDSPTDPRNHIFSHTYTPTIPPRDITITVNSKSLNTGSISKGSKVIKNMGGISSRDTKKHLLNSTILDNGNIVYNLQIDTNNLNTLSEPASTSQYIQYDEINLYSVKA